MPNFTRLQNKAMFLSRKLNKSYIEKHGGIFSCFPWCGPSEKIMDDVDLIMRTADCLDNYKVTDAEKFLVLQGIYIYAWQHYEGNLQWVLNRPFLTLLSKHLEIDSLAVLDDTTYNESMGALATFCKWVFRYRQYTQFKELYEAFPADMQATIGASRVKQPAADSIWNNISNRVSSSVNGLF